jgi:RNA polymerase sigma-70 factor (ECF subfamily)
MTKRTNEQWLADLHNPGPAKEEALSDLRSKVLAGLPYALSSWLDRDDPNFDSLAEEVTQETLIRVLDRLDTFEGRSQFTTWVHAIAVRIALTELRRRKWQNVSLDGLVERDEMQAGHARPELMEDPRAGPEIAVEKRDLMALIQRIILEELTEKQRQALMGVGQQGMPLEEVARRMGMERNALYKLLHDARLKLKKRMAVEGITPGDALAAFEKR